MKMERGDRVGDYVIEEIIYTSVISQIYTGIDTITGERVILKCTKQRNEMEIHSQLDHPNIIRYRDFIQTETAYILVMDYAKMGTLYDLIADPEQCITEEDTKRFMYNILTGLAYLHSHDVVHCDIKPENILIDDTMTAVISDFGKSFDLTNLDTKYSSYGTFEYSPPEAMSTRNATCKEDIWACGILMYLCLARKFPFETDDFCAMLRIIQDGIPAFPALLDELDVSQEVKHLIQQMIQPNPEERISAAVALEHPWFCSLHNVSSLIE